MQKVSAKRKRKLKPSDLLKKRDKWLFKKKQRGFVLKKKPNVNVLKLNKRKSNQD